MRRAVRGPRRPQPLRGGHAAPLLRHHSLVSNLVFDHVSHYLRAAALFMRACVNKSNRLMTGSYFPGCLMAESARHIVNFTGFVNFTMWLHDVMVVFYR